MGFLAGAVGALAGGAVDFFGQRKARKNTEESIRRALGFQQQGIDANYRGYQRASGYMDDLLGEASTLEDDLLGLVDPVTANEARRISQEQEMASAMTNADMAGRGLDSFTTRMGAQATVRGQTQNALSDLQARMSTRRMLAMSRGRGAYMNALGQRAGFEQGISDRQTDQFNRMAQIQAGVQYQAPGGGEGIGRLSRDVTQWALDGFNRKDL